MSILKTKIQLAEAIEAYEELRSQVDKDQKTNLNQYSEEEWSAHLRDLGQKTANLLHLTRNVDDQATLERLEKKQKKLKRHKLWQKRHKKRVQKEKKQLQKRNAQWIKDIQWKVTMSPSANSLLLKQKQESEAKAQEEHIDDEATQISKLREFLNSLIELRNLRRRKLEAKGHFFADDGDQFFNQVSEMQVDNAIEENKESVESDSADEASDKNDLNLHENDSWNDMGLDKEAYRYWCSADQSLDSLLTMRRLWDQYIKSNSDDNDTLHKVPPTFVIPPPPANGVWASYLI